MENKGSEVSYQNDVFFKFALAGDDESSKFIRHGIIEYLTGIKVKDSIVLNPELNAQIFHKKNIILDIRVRDEEGREYDFEMQVAGTKLTEMKRFEFYGVKMVSEQLEEGDAYEELQPIYQIIFIDKLSNNKNELIRYCQMQDQHGEVEYEDALIHRIYIHFPAINNILKTKPFSKLDAFEKMCYLFKNNENHAILNAKERLVKSLMEKHEQMRDNRSIWSIARAQQIGERRYENIKNDCFNEGKVEGKIEGENEGYRNILHNQIVNKYAVDALDWLSTLSKEQLINVSNIIFHAATFEELKHKTQ